jgi:hypothetical protein
MIQNGVHGRFIVNTIMNLRARKYVENFVSGRESINSKEEEGLCSMEMVKINFTFAY